MLRTTHLARSLRNTPTDAEKLLWRHLKQRQVNNLKFRRQVSIGFYVVDFLCFEKRLIIELDGGQHGDEKDKQRTAFLESKGFLVIRFWNNDVLKNTKGVLEKIHEITKTPS
jgi:very-short-patch-repair endonuclease